MTERSQPDRDRSLEQGPRRADPFPLYGVLDNLRSAFNVGSIFRTSEAARIAGLHLIGICPYPPNAKLDRTALGTTYRVPWKHHVDPAEALRDLRSREIPVWAVELHPDARSLRDVAFPQPVAVVFGHEVAGVSASILDTVDRIVAIPLHGRKNSLNVATAFGIVVFEALRQWGR